jgi:F0F1-type ATP synthase membrane subunit b/b'
MQVPNLTDPVFIAKVVDFIIFVVAIVWIWQRYLQRALVAAQEAQNKRFEDAVAARAENEGRVGLAAAGVEAARAAAARMIDVAASQAKRTAVETLAAAQEHSQRIVAHAAGELDRERYRVRREVLENTVERAYSRAKLLATGELDAVKQRALLDRSIDELERAHG